MQITNHVHLRLLTDRATLILTGEFTVDAMQQGLLALSHAVQYYRYDTIQFLINSIGGEVEALQVLEAAMSWYRAQGKRIVTSAWGRAHSAASLAVALGDPGWRIIRGDTTMLLHASRFSFKEPTTLEPRALERMLRSQESFLEQYARKLAQHANGRIDDAVEQGWSGGQPHAPSAGFSRVNMATAAASTALEPPSQPGAAAFLDLFREESVLLSSQARKWRLVDHVVASPDHEMARWLTGLC